MNEFRETGLRKRLDQASSSIIHPLLMQADGRRGTTMEDVAAAESRRETTADPADDPGQAPRPPLTVA